MAKCERRRSAALLSTPEDGYADSFKQQKLGVDSLKQPSMGYALSIKNAQPTPKKLILSRTTRPMSYAAATSDIAAYEPQFTLARARPRSTSPQPSPRLVPATPLVQAERSPRTQFKQSFFKLGMIIEAPLMEEDFMYGASLTSVASALRCEFSITPSHYGYVHTKMRKFVVVALFAQHYLAVPMYTHNGDGLNKKPIKDEFVSVRDDRAKGNGERLSDHDALVAEMQPEALRLYEKTAVHFAYAVSRNYQLRVNYLGGLDGESRGRLLSLFREYLGGGAERGE